jgi:hypothetical protein
MARGDKNLDRMRKNPRDWRIDSLELIARANGVNVRKSGGSPFGGRVRAGPATDQASLYPSLCKIDRRGEGER